jgi:hypothetical protein
MIREVRAAEFSLDLVAEIKFLGRRPARSAGVDVPQPAETNFALDTGCETKVVGAGRVQQRRADQAAANRGFHG